MPKKITLSDRVEHLEKQMQSPIIVPRGEPIEVNQESSWKEWIIPCLVIVSMCFIGCYLGARTALNLEEKVIPAVNEEEKTVLQEKVEEVNSIKIISMKDGKEVTDSDLEVYSVTFKDDRAD